MQALADYLHTGTVIRPLVTDHPARCNAVSRDLRGLLDYARRAAVACVITRADPDNPLHGLLWVIYADGSIGRASFASHHILIDWVRNRRTWRQATIRHLDGDMGYLTRPGVIAGA
jgi:hypothetical protein